MKTLKTATNRNGFYFWECYRRSTTYSVINAYKTTPCKKSIEAEEDIRREMYDNNGNDYRILSAGSYNYTCGYKLSENVLIVHTRDNIYRVEYNGEYDR